MPGLATLLMELRARHQDYFLRRWDSLSANDAKAFCRLELDIAEVRAALGGARTPDPPDLQAIIARLQASMGEPERSGQEGSFPEPARLEAQAQPVPHG